MIRNIQKIRRGKRITTDLVADKIAKKFSMILLREKGERVEPMLDIKTKTSAARMLWRRKGKKIYFLRSSKERNSLRSQKWENGDEKTPKLN